MFCPLCQSEFRDGITQCSDCRVALVATADEAQLASARLWKGASQCKLDKILAALDAQSIPSRCKEIVNMGARFRIVGIPIGPNPSTFEYEVWVFRSDLDAAQHAIENV